MSLIWFQAGILVVALFILVTTWLILMSHGKRLRRELLDITERVHHHLEQSAKWSQQTGEGTVKVVSDVYTRLGILEESSRRIIELGAEIGQLQDVLKAPKARGGFGEFLLADLIAQMIPQDHFQLQYQFRNGSRVDATVLVGNRIVPIDAKFPLENFQRLLSVPAEEKKKIRKEFARDVKRHVDAIAERYIQPDEGTFDFALMYIPAESVYYEVIIPDEEEGRSSLSHYALQHNVIPVSPNSFYAYLQVILMGLRGLKVDEAAREIAESLTKMQSDFKRILGNYDTLGSHLNHAKNAFDRVQRDMDQFEGKLALVDQVHAVASEKKDSLETTA
ncbi:MAG: hypothetical protein A3J52_02615 [Omnitrophica bacterium RIFCSPHIGHO2_02_FULL_49_9]|nr:MAG: hypothetical protein A3J52_02615 [Omnitrophica bacterium RIFCSPHIGHO2_02_FULL_49_9]OGW89464.1 MAG: hypothetical protein A3A73_04345 [Omnitrophica bacterium RIFCSPLOWO2_01_FULL_50_24]